MKITDDMKTKMNRRLSEHTAQQPVAVVKHRPMAQTTVYLMHEAQTRKIKLSVTFFGFGRNVNFLQ